MANDIYLSDIYHSEFVRVFVYIRFMVILLLLYGIWICGILDETIAEIEQFSAGRSIECGIFNAYTNRSEQIC